MPDAPVLKRKATSGTRKGNGPGMGTGYGGKARAPGEAKGTRADKPAAPQFEAGNKAAAGWHDMSKSERMETLKQRLYDLATGAESQMVQMHAADKLLDRLEGKAIARTELTGRDGAPLTPPSLILNMVKPAGG